MAKLLEQSNKPLRVKDSKTLAGPFTVLGVFNQNERRYPERVYEEAYEELVPKIKERRLLGELDHPIDYDEIRLSNVSHVITECHIGTSKSGNKVVYGTVELLDTPAGKVAQALVDAGVPLGISSRGIGNTKQVSEGLDVTQLKLITYDLVAEPSFEVALLSEEKKNKLSEDLQFIEKKLPLKESKNSDRVRSTINQIRESLSLSEAGVHIDQQKLKTKRVSATQKLLDSKNKVIASDTKLLKENRKKLKEYESKLRLLESKVSEMNSRYTKLQENHQTLQESYNNVKKEYQRKERNLLEMSNREIIELKKKLAVEQRGMSYMQVKNLLEGANEEKEIRARLDSISKMNRRSSSLEVEDFDTIKESISSSSITSNKANRLAKVVAKI